MSAEPHARQKDDVFVYHPRTADQLDISPMPDGLGVLIGIYNNRDNGQYTAIDVSLGDIERVVRALRDAKMQAQVKALPVAKRYAGPQCHHEDMSCPPEAPCGDYSGRDGRDG